MTTTGLGELASELTAEELEAIAGAGKPPPRSPWGQGGGGTRPRGRQTGRDRQGRPTYDPPATRAIPRLNLPPSVGSILRRL